MLPTKSVNPLLLFELWGLKIINYVIHIIKFYYMHVP